MPISHDIELYAGNSENLIEEENGHYVFNEKTLNIGIKNPKKITINCYKDVEDLCKYHNQTDIETLACLSKNKENYMSKFGGYLNPSKQDILSYPLTEKDLKEPFQKIKKRLLAEIDPKKYPRHIANIENPMSFNDGIVNDVGKKEILLLCGKNAQYNLTFIPKEKIWFSFFLKKEEIFLKNITTKTIIEQTWAEINKHQQKTEHEKIALMQHTKEYIESLLPTLQDRMDSLYNEIQQP